MTDRELENRLAQALDHAAPDDFADVLSRLGPGKGNVIDMTTLTNQNDKNKKKKPWLRGLIAACLALVLLGAGAGGGMWYQRNYAVASVISLDVNPSIELKVNQNERVLTCAALNDDAAAVLAEMDGGKDLVGAKLDVAVNAIVGALVRHGYLDSLSSAILISVEDNNSVRGARLQQELVATVDSVLQTAANQASVLSQNLTVDAGLESQAQANNISTGKAALVNQVIGLNSSLKFEDLAKLSVEELRDLIRIGAPAMPIGRDAAKYAAEEYAGTLTLDSVTAEVDPELDEPVPCYEVELLYGGREYDYTVDAFSGAIHSGQKDIASGAGTQTPSTQTPDTQTTTNPAPAVTADQALSAAEEYHTAKYPELAGTDRTNIKVDFDQDDNDYEVEFWCNNYEFDYTVDASTGAVLKSDTDYRTPTTPTTPSNGTTTDIGADAAKAAALRHAGLSDSQVTWNKAERDYDDGRLEYELEFVYNNTEYDYTIDGVTGTVLKYENEILPTVSTGTAAPSTGATTDIGADAAKAAALQHAGLSESQVTGLKVERDYENDHHSDDHHSDSHHGRLEYEVEFRSGGYEYEYTIDGATGAVLDHECDWDD